MAVSQSEKAQRFRTLHDGPGTFVIPNPWDAGTARILTSLGFPALATTSAGFAFSIGRQDDVAVLGRDEVLAHVKSLVAATDLPVSAETIRRAGQRDWGQRDGARSCLYTMANRWLRQMMASRMP